jgi:soluble lytic murein transglycosylase-like protein
MAKQLGMAHETRQLTADPAHNAVLGAAYLAQMIEEFGPTVAMVAAGYNAGPAARAAGSASLAIRARTIRWIGSRRSPLPKPAPM